MERPVHRLLLLCIAALLLSWPLRADTDHDQLLADASNQTYEKYEDVVAATKTLYDAGVDRRKIAVWLEEVVDQQIINTNDPVEIIGRSLVILAPYRTSQVAAGRSAREELGLDYETYGVIARMAWDAGVGQCEENANIVYGILKDAGVDENLRMVEVNGAHIFPVWGLADGADINDPSTWGPDALIVDSWYGGVLEPKDVEENWWFRNGDKDKKISDETRGFDEKAEPWVTKDKPAAAGSSMEEDCFIASSVFGTPLAPQVQALRRYRDQRLIRSAPGRWLIAYYNTFGPVLAYWLNDHPQYKPWVRRHLVTPALRFANRQMQRHEDR